MSTKDKDGNEMDSTSAVWAPVLYSADVTQPAQLHLAHFVATSPTTVLTGSTISALATAYDGVMTNSAFTHAWNLNNIAVGVGAPAFVVHDTSINSDISYTIPIVVQNVAPASISSNPLATQQLFDQIAAVQPNAATAMQTAMPSLVITFDSTEWSTQLATCFDGVKNGGETDIDCGGSDSRQCGAASECAVDADWLTELCSRYYLRCYSADDTRSSSAARLAVPPASSFAAVVIALLAALLLLTHM